MKKFQHISSNQKKRYTFLIIPNSTGRVIEINIPSWLPKLSIISIVLLLFVSIFSTNSLVGTRQKLNIASSRVLELEDKNLQQANEIASLNLHSKKVKEELEDLDKLKTQVLDMVGLESQSNVDGDEDNPLLVVSRSYQRPVSSGGGGDFEKDMVQLEELIERQKETMNKLAEDVGKQLEYLDALPNIMPAKGRITSPFGYRISPINRRREFHKGVDIANRSNTQILAAGAGMVTYSGYNGAYGRMIIISHGNGYSSVYAHNRSNLVEVGQRVDKGQVIAKMGSTGRSTGPHVHFETRLHGNPINPKELWEN